MAERKGHFAPVGPGGLPGTDQTDVSPKDNGRAPGKGRKAKARKKMPWAKRKGSARRNHKDSLFCRLFSDRENALSLYNALTGSSYTDADGLEIVTLEDAVYLSQKNDCAVCVQASLALFEQQSSWNPNMPLRGFLYFAAEYAGWLARHEVDVHSSTLVKIPAPSYFVLYNGMEKLVERIDLRLSEAFEKPAEGYEWTAHVVNVNAGHNTSILERCPLLGDYAAFIGDIRQGQAKGLSLTKAVDAAVMRCIRRGGKLAVFMRKHKAEVNSMYLFGVDFDKIHRKAVRDAIRKEVREECFAEGREESLRNLMDSLKLTAVQAMDALKIPADEREKYASKLAQEM